MLPKKKILQTEVTDASEDQILEYVFVSLEKTKEKITIVTPNPEIVTYAVTHPTYAAILNSAQIALADGTGLLVASWILGKPLLHRITGVDFLDKLCEHASNLSKKDVRKTVSIGFLGGRDGVALESAKRLQRLYPHMHVSFIGEELDEGVWIPEEYQVKVVEYIQSQKLETGNSKLEKHNPASSIQHPASGQIDILFVAFGFPKQEEWIAANLEKLPVRLMMGVGGSFDFISGKVDRAPMWIRIFGFEWLYRLKREPKRWRRQLSLITFICLVLKERFSSAS